MIFFERLLIIVRFVIKFVKNFYLKVSRMVRKVFLLVVKFSIYLEFMMEDLYDMLLVLDEISVKFLKKRMFRILDDFNLFEKLVYELYYGIIYKNNEQDYIFENFFLFLFESIFRCNFFVIVFLECLSEVSGLNKGRFLLLVFFNILIRVRKECKYELIENEIVNEKCDIKK